MFFLKKIKVDERAVLKHFEWPERKADALREAAFGYCDLKKLESEASSFRDDPRQPCAPALKKMQGLFEKYINPFFSFLNNYIIGFLKFFYNGNFFGAYNRLEHGVYNLSRMRESASTRYKVFQIPMGWMEETGFATQVFLLLLFIFVHVSFFLFFFTYV